MRIASPQPRLDQNEVKILARFGDCLLNNDLNHDDEDEVQSRHLFSTDRARRKVENVYETVSKRYMSAHLQTI